MLLTDIDTFDKFFESHLYNNPSVNLKTNYIGAGIPTRKMKERVLYYNCFISLWRSSNRVVRKIGTTGCTIINYIQKALGVNRWKRTEMVLYQGSSWWSITDAFAEYVLSKKKWIKSQFSIRTFAADEFAVQTIIMNSPFKESRYRPEEGINSNLRLLDFNRGNQYGSPYVWRFSDRDEIKNSPNLIGRKFDETIDKGIVDFVLNKIKHKE